MSTTPRLTPAQIKDREETIRHHCYEEYPSKAVDEVFDALRAAYDEIDALKASAEWKPTHRKKAYGGLVRVVKRDDDRVYFNYGILHSVKSEDFERIYEPIPAPPGGDDQQGETQG